MGSSFRILTHWCVPKFWILAHSCFVNFRIRAHRCVLRFRILTHRCDFEFMILTHRNLTHRLVLSFRILSHRCSLSFRILTHRCVLNFGILTHRCVSFFRSLTHRCVVNSRTLTDRQVRFSLQDSHTQVFFKHKSESHTHVCFKFQDSRTQVCLAFSGFGGFWFLFSQAAVAKRRRSCVTQEPLPAVQHDATFWPEEEARMQPAMSEPSAPGISTPPNPSPSAVNREYLLALAESKKLTNFRLAGATKHPAIQDGAAPKVQHLAGPRCACPQTAHASLSPWRPSPRRAL